MALIARILGVSLLTSALVTGLGLGLLASVSDLAVPSAASIFPAFILGCVGGIIGAVAGAVREIVTAQHRKFVNWADANP